MLDTNGRRRRAHLGGIRHRRQQLRQQRANLGVHPRECDAVGATRLRGAGTTAGVAGVATGVCARGGAGHRAQPPAAPALALRAREIGGRAGRGDARRHGMRRKRGDQRVQHRRLQRRVELRRGTAEAWRGAGAGWVGGSGSLAAREAGAPAMRGGWSRTRARLPRGTHSSRPAPAPAACADRATTPRRGTALGRASPEGTGWGWLVTQRASSVSEGPGPPAVRLVGRPSGLLPGRPQTHLEERLREASHTRWLRRRAGGGA